MADRRLVFQGPRSVLAEEFEVTAPGPGQVTIKTVVSGISAGTEGLLWKGTWPPGTPLDEVWNPAPGTANYPVAYGYAAVGRIEILGPEVDTSWRGRLVFSFTGHQTRVTVDLDKLVPLPPEIQPEDGVFLATMETALSLVQDAAPVVGETVGVWGLGSVGMLVAAVASRSFAVKAWDAQPFRRNLAEAFGICQVFRPTAKSCDAVIELTGNPQVLDEAIEATRYSGRIVLGSWYGSIPVTVALGGDFHRARIQLVSSQVSAVSPLLSGRWSKSRRIETAVALVAHLKPSRLVTHRYSLDQASQAYQQACDHPEDGLQVVFTYA